MLKDAFDDFQEASEDPLYGNPLLSDYVDLLIKLFQTPREELPRLILISSGPTRKEKLRAVIFDTKIWKPIVVKIDAEDHATCTRSVEMQMYLDFARKSK
jgi:hypothetical protein